MFPHQSGRTLAQVGAARKVQTGRLLFAFAHCGGDGSNGAEADGGAGMRKGGDSKGGEVRKEVERPETLWKEVQVLRLKTPGDPLWVVRAMRA